jgi:hypothetical protein
VAAAARPARLKKSLEISSPGRKKAPKLSCPGGKKAQKVSFPAEKKPRNFLPGKKKAEK